MGDRSRLKLGIATEIVLAHHRHVGVFLHHNALDPLGAGAHRPIETTFAFGGMRDLHFLRHLGHVHGPLHPADLAPLLERLLQTQHLVRLSVHEDHVRGIQRVEELGSLREVGVRRERDGVHLAPERKTRTRLGHDVLRTRENVPGQRSLHCKVRDDGAILRIPAPRLKQLPGHAALQHGGRGHHHTRPHVVKLASRPKMRHVLELKRI